MTKRLAVFFAAGVFLAATGSAQEKKDQPDVLKKKVKMVEGLRFYPPRFSVKKEKRIELTLENHDPNDQPHNFVLIKPGTLQEIQISSMQIGPDSVANGFVPKSDAIIVASGLLNADEKETLTFDTPKEPGIYIYVCTFPGHANVMYGALYVNTKWADTLSYDPNIPEMIRNEELQKTRAIMEVERPSFSRFFMPDAGPAAIAMALPGEQNVCWDAGNCRMRYAWTGAFVDPTRLFNSNGNALVKILGDVYWKSQMGENIFGVQFGDTPTTAIDFKGYQLIDGVPEFRYHVDGVPVRELITTGESGGLSWRFKIEKAPTDVRILAPKAEGVAISSRTGKRSGDFWIIPQQDAAEFTLNLITE